MGLTKINQILKKYKQAYKDHIASWDEAQKRIRAANKKLQDEMNDPDKIYICEKTYQHESFQYHLKGFQLFDKMMKELESHEIFPKKINNKNKAK